MSTVNRTIENDTQKTMAVRLIEGRTLPFTLTLTDGKHRTTAQNKLQHMWMKEIAEQRGDMTASEARAYCKLTIGIPLLREENEAFKIRYDEILKPLSYEQKMAVMMEPFDLAVTRLMTTKQKTEYLDRIVRHFSEQGIILTMPEDHKYESGPSAPEEPVPAEDGAPTVSAASDDAAPSPSSDAPHYEWLLNITKMLWGATNPGGELSVLVNQKKAALASYPTPADLPNIIRGKAEAVYGYAKQIINCELDQQDGLALIAGVVGVDQDDIGRVA